MATMKQVRAVVFANAHPAGRDAYDFRIKITDGPDAFLDRFVTVRITGEQFDQMRQMVDGNREAIKRTEEMVKRVNESNAAYEESDS